MVATGNRGTSEAHEPDAVSDGMCSTEQITLTGQYCGGETFVIN